MGVSDEDIAFVYDLYSALPDLSHRKMMGGLSIYSQGTIFAILSSEGQHYIKATGQLAEDLAAEGSVIFEMTRKDGKVASMGYWTLPDSAIEDPDEACAWARRSLTEN
ncbi:MAG: TfoX/Sxy family protein [Pseudomonadota bacterium]